MRRSIGIVAFVIAAMAVGRLITDLVPTANVVDKPFVHPGGVGSVVKLEFADVKVTKTQVTPTITGSPAAKAGGRWLIVETEVTATQSPTFIALPTLIDSRGRHHLPSQRGTDCSINANLATDVPWQVSFCFDVAREALPESKILLARGAYGDEGDDFRRDAVAEVDLDLSRAEVDGLWAQTAAVDVEPAGIRGGKS